MPIFQIVILMTHFRNIFFVFALLCVIAIAALAYSKAKLECRIWQPCLRAKAVSQTDESLYHAGDGVWRVCRILAWSQISVLKIAQDL